MNEAQTRLNKIDPKLRDAAHSCPPVTWESSQSMRCLQRLAILVGKGTKK